MNAAFITLEDEISGITKEIPAQIPRNQRLEGVFSGSIEKFCSIRVEIGVEQAAFIAKSRKQTSEP